MIDPFAKPLPSPMTFEAGDTVVLCEGFDECAVLRQLCQGWRRPPKIGTSQERRNKGDELRDLVIQVSTHRISTIGLVFDAESDRSARKSEIVGWLRGAGFKPPRAPMRLAKSVVGGATVSVAYLINPHGKRGSAIESYFLPQVRKTTRWSCIENLLECYRSNEPTAQLEEKVILRTFIAHKNARNTGLNAAFTKNILRCEHPALDPVRKFLALLRSASPVEQSARA
jgi:hypothetical protein